MARQRKHSEWQNVRMHRSGGTSLGSNVAANRDTIPSPWAPDRLRVDARKFSVLTPTRQRVASESARGNLQIQNFRVKESSIMSGLLQWATFGLFVLCGVLMLTIVLLIST